MNEDDKNPPPLPDAAPKPEQPQGASAMRRVVRAPASDSGILATVKRHLDEVDMLSRLVGPTPEMRIVQEILDREEHVKRMLEPSPLIAVLREQEEREKLIRESMFAEIKRSNDLASVAIREQATFSSLALEFSGENNSVLQAIRAHEREYGDIQRHLRESVLASAVDFQRPALFQVEGALKSASDGSVSAWLKRQGEAEFGVIAWVERERARSEALARSFSSIQSPWVRVSNVDMSLRAMMEFASVGAALKTVHPFDDGFAASLRIDLGDWRHAPTIDPLTLRTPSARSKYYVERGLDTSLTDFTDEAFAEGLSAAELCDNYLAGLDPEALAAEGIDPKVEVAIRQTAICQRVVTALEFELRAFIERLMTSSYGEKWAKTNLDPTLYEKWKGKLEAAQKSGYPNDRLIEFADFTDYPLIICRKGVFAAVFAGHFRDETFVRESFSRLHPLRLAAMHSRPMTNKDIVYAVVEASRLTAAMRLAP